MKRVIEAIVEGLVTAVVVLAFFGLVLFAIINSPRSSGGTGGQCHLHRTSC